MKVLDPDEEKAKQDPAYHLKSTNLETRETLAELYKEYKGDELLASTMKEPEAKKTDKFNARERAQGLMLTGRLEFVSTSIRSGQANPRAKQVSVARHFSTEPGCKEHTVLLFRPKKHGCVINREGIKVK
ncbi:RING-type E3 ubiquitin-protein ligase PPIL2-like isoform X1 [Tachysurus fulvidraco]|uniref:RING-type E3 ubiquitin-protein ligase PPIL2-like isoform X1 n=1 Tax=Tachysurus fulvidraco TaxID=1234273 RepID=UPI001FEF2390|nr:RING-type E3 ubiquitin-protein ligase PPIL2-like isoform X1 [Tachysurus fulvidraco]